MIRVSFQAYNSVAEADRLLKALEPLLRLPEWRDLQRLCECGTTQYNIGHLQAAAGRSPVSLGGT